LKLSIKMAQAICACPQLFCFITLEAAVQCWAGLGWAWLCCAVLCCAVLCCAVLCCAVLCCAVLCLAVLGCALSNLQCQSHCSSEDASVRVDYSAMCGADPWVDTLCRWKMEKQLSSSISRHMALWHISVSMAVWHRHYCNLFGALLSHAFEQVVLSGCRLPTFIVC